MSYSTYKKFNNNNNILNVNDDNISITYIKENDNNNILKKNLSNFNIDNNNFAKNFILHPRTNELINDKIFQFFFQQYFNSKDFHEFKNLNDNEKLNFMIDLYFYVICDNNNDDNNSINNNNNSNIIIDENNFNNEISDRINLLKNENSKNNIINLMKKYGIYNLSSNFNNNNYYENYTKNKEDTFNSINNNNNLFNNNINIINTNNKKNNTTTTTTKNIFNTFPFNNNNNLNNNINNITSYNNNINNNATATTNFLKVDLNNNNIFKIGKISNGNFYNLNEENIKEIKFSIDKNIFISKNNEIKEDDQMNFILNKTKTKFNNPNLKKDFLISLNYKTLKNKNKFSKINLNNNNKNNNIFYDSFVMTQFSYFPNFSKNMILLKNKNLKNNNNEIIKKLFFNENEIVFFNQNEINKIGILLINYFKIYNNNKDLKEENLKYKNKIQNMKELLMNYTNNAKERIIGSKKFLDNINNIN